MISDQLKEQQRTAANDRCVNDSCLEIDDRGYVCTRYDDPTEWCYVCLLRTTLTREDGLLYDLFAARGQIEALLPTPTNADFTLEAGHVCTLGPMPRSLGDYAHAIRVYVEEEQRKLAPNNALISLLCDSLRLAWENLRLAGVSR